jgi:hypothetical protein
MSDLHERHGGIPWGKTPFQNAHHFHFPGAMNPPGFTMPNEPIDDPANLERKFRDEHHRDKGPKPQEIKNLNQYTGFFTTPEGDFPVSVVADSIKEAAKILTMPGVFGEHVTEPSTIKFVKGKIAVSVPVRMSGFNVRIHPQGAIDSGAFATPSHAEVRNGTEVIFTAHEPFGWKFKGWYKGHQLLSTEKVSWIEVYDPYSSLIEYTAGYEFDPILRNGRYLELGHGWYFDFKFDGWSTFDGRMILYTNVVPDWHFVLREGSEKGKYGVEADQTVVQEPQIGMTITLTPTPIGFNLTVNNVTDDNPFGIIQDQVFSLKWVGDHQAAFPKSFTNRDLENQTTPNN